MRSIVDLAGPTRPHSKGQEMEKRFKPGTTPGEAAWLIARCMEALAPMAVALFARQSLSGAMELDYSLWTGAAESMAISIQDRAFKLTDGFGDDKDRNHEKSWIG